MEAPAVLHNIVCIIIFTPIPTATILSKGGWFAIHLMVWRYFIISCRNCKLGMCIFWRVRHLKTNGTALQLGALFQKLRMPFWSFEISVLNCLWFIHASIPYVCQHRNTVHESSLWNFKLLGNCLIVPVQCARLCNTTPKQLFTTRLEVLVYHKISKSGTNGIFAPVYRTPYIVPLVLAFYGIVFQIPDIPGHKWI